MFEVVQVQSGGVSRRALMTVPPAFVVRNPDDSLTVQQGAPLALAVVLPDDCQVHVEGWTRNIFHAPGMFSPVGRLELNPDDPYLLAEIVVHELVHYYQRSRMGPAAYFATFVYQSVLAFLRAGFGWHTVHLMEREARRIAREIIDAWVAAGSTGPIDAVLEIQRRLT